MILRRAAILFAGLVLVGCQGPSSPDAREQRVVIFAAASLRDVFTALGDELERAHPGAALHFNFAGTQELRLQLEHGAAADVFASADTRSMDALSDASLVAAPVVFARNEPVLVVATDAKVSIESLADLPDASRIVLGAPEVPIGRYTLELLDRASARLGSDFRARVEAKVVSRELNVRQVLAKVRLGEADAGIVYRSDALAAGDSVRIVPLGEELEVVADYAIAVTTQAAHPDVGRAWIDLVLSARGRRALREAGFIPPDEAASSR